MTALPQPNLPLLRKAVEWAEAEALKPPEQREWYQPYYVFPASNRSRAYGQPCGTAYCIAGYIGHITVGVDEDGDTPDGRTVCDFAEEALGLTDREVSNLFFAGNSIDDIRQIAEAIAARAGERL